VGGHGRAAFLYAAGSSRGARFNHGRRRAQRGDWTVITIQGADLAAAIGSRQIRYRPWDRAVVVIGAGGYHGPAVVTSGVVLVDWEAGRRTRDVINVDEPSDHNSHSRPTTRGQG
jgi:hypothetical protein